MFEVIPFRKNNGVRRGDDFFNNFIGNFFDEDFMTPLSLIGNNFKVDLKETETSYLVEADLPGIKKEAIDIDYNDNYLTITAKRDEAVEDKNENYVRRERHYGEFKRRFYVDNVDESKIDASFSDGVLKVTLPKQEKGQPPKRKIDIH